MSWTSPLGHIWVTGEIVTAANLNTYVTNNLDDLDRRTSPSGSVTVNNDPCTSGTYVSLATLGPAVTVTIGTTLKASLFLFAAIQGSVAGNECFMGFVISGATSRAATDGTAISFTPGSAGGASHVGAPMMLTSSELTASGSTTFTAVYKRNTSGTANFSDRRLAVTPFGA